MRKSSLVIVLAALAAYAVFGCGGGGNSFTGGSVPVGGRAVSGAAVLPNSTPASNSPVSLRVLATGALVNSTVTDSTGRFSVSNVPVDNDIDVIVSQQPNITLETVIPAAALQVSQSTLNIGNITAITSVESAALKLEEANDPEDEASIVANQSAVLLQATAAQNLTIQQQEQFIANPNQIDTFALTLLGPVANTELSQLSQQPNNGTASSALNGLLGYMRAAHKHQFHLTGKQRQALIAAQLAGTSYTAGNIATALQAAGVPAAQATPGMVSAGSAQERVQLTAFAANGSSISPFEAFVIAADVNADGGFECSQNELNLFITSLVGP